MRQILAAAALLVAWTLGWTGVAFALQPPSPAARAIAQGLPLTPQMFGATGDGIADDSGAIAAWLGSGHPLFCNGTFKLTRAVAVDLKPFGGLYLQGSGRQLCKLVLATPAAGVTINGGTPDYTQTAQVVMHDFSLAPAAALTGPALTIAFTGGSGSTDPTLDLRDIAIKPTADDVSAPTCLKLDNVRNGIVSGINCDGAKSTWAAGSRGIVVTGDSQPVELLIQGSVTAFMDVGISLEGTWQGIAITEAACVGCRVGVRATASDNAGVWLRVLDSHFNVEDFGVEAINIATVHATGNFIYLNDVAPSQSRYHACFSLTMQSQATQWAKVSGNACDGTQLTASPKLGVFIDSARKPGSFLMEDRIEGNSFYALDYGVFLANATSVYVGPNTFADIRKGNILNRGTGAGIFESTQAPPPVGLPSDAQ